MPKNGTHTGGFTTLHFILTADATSPHWPESLLQLGCVQPIKRSHTAGFPKGSWVPLKPRSSHLGVPCEEEKTLATRY